MISEYGVFFFSSKCEVSPENFFHGIGIGDGLVRVGDGVITDEEALNIFGSLREGRFLACGVDRTSGEANIRTDSFGAEPIFIYQDEEEGRWAISNSLQYLAEKVSEAGWKLDVNVPAVVSMFVKGSLGQQPISSKTAYEKIALLDSDFYVSLTNNYKCMRILPHEKSVIENSYSEELVKWFDEWRSVFTSLSEFLGHESPLMFDISGGVDSRMMFSLALSLPTSAEFSFYTQGHKGDDRRVATELCKFYGLPLSYEEPNWGGLPVKIQYRLYTLGKCLI